MTNRPEAVLFDFDGTLVHITIDFEAMRNNALAVVRRYGETPEGGSFTLEIVEAARDRLARRDAALAARFQEEALASICAVEMEAAEHAEPLPGVPETLAWLEEQGIRVGIVTRNCRAAVSSVAERHGLEFDVVLTRDDVKHVKPHPGHLLQALEALGASPRRSIMVGDHPTDIAAAHAAAMVGCAVTTTRGADGFDGRPDFIIDEIGALVPLIESGSWRKLAEGVSRNG